MPTYVWRCNGCQEQTEIVRSIKDYDKGPDLCSKCQGTDLARVIEARPFHLKGDTGWHNKEYTKYRSIR